MSYLATTLATFALAWILLSIVMLTAAGFGEKVLDEIPKKYPGLQGRFIQVGVTIVTLILAPLVFFSAFSMPLNGPGTDADDDTDPPVQLGEFRYVPAKRDDVVN
jgi:hypothetical protein